MIRLFMMLTALTLISCHNEAQTSDTSIIGGRVAQDRDFMVGLSSSPDANDTYCGGTLIEKRVAITAAHCVTGEVNDVYTRLGMHTSDDDPVVRVSAIVVHPDYDDSMLFHDIAILILEDYDATAFETMPQPIALNTDPYFPLEHTSSELTVIGRGNTTSFGTRYIDDLRELTVNVVPLADCKAAYGADDVTGGQLCAGFIQDGSFDSCQGDSGGPLVAIDDGETKLVGIVSWGFGCAQKNKPGVYSRASFDAGWVESTLAILRTPADQLSGESVEAMMKAHCYSVLDGTESDGVENFDWERTTQWLSDSPFAVSDIASNNDDPTCQFRALNGTPYQINIEDEIIVSSVEANTHWRAAAKQETLVNYISCQDGISRSLKWGEKSFNYASVQGAYYFLGSPTDLPDTTFDISCEGDTDNMPGFTFHIAGGDGELQYFVTLHRLVPGAAGVMESVTMSATKWERGGATTELTVAIDTMTNKLSVTNETETDIFTWDLVCNFGYELTDSFGLTYASQPVDGLDGLIQNSVSFIHPAQSHGSILSGETASFQLNLTEALPIDPSCSLNGVSAQMQVN